MCASHPHSLNFATWKSAFALSWGDPTWLGSADSCSSHVRISAGSIAASNAFSLSISADEAADLKPIRPAGSALPAHARIADAERIGRIARIDFMGGEK